MKVEINRRPVEVGENCESLAALLAQEGFDGKGQAVAVDNKVVPRTQWESYKLADGMNITIIRAVCGG